MTSTHQAAHRTGSTMRLRILIATDTYPPDVNGASYFTYRLATGLAERGHDVHVVCASASGPPRVEVQDGVVLHRMRSVPVLVHPTMRTALPLGLTGHIARIVDRLAPHVVHVQSHFTISRTALRCGRMAGVPVVLTNHFMPDNLFAHAHIPPRLHGVVGSLAWQDMIRVARTADYVTTPTQRAAELLASKGFTRTVEAVSCGIDLDRFRPRPQDRAQARAHFGLPDRETMVFVGRLDEEKRIDESIRALPVLLRHRDVQLVLAGTGQRREELERLARSLGVAERVHFLGFVPDDDLPLVYVAADLFVIGSVAELQSIATLEAMSTGLPVVAADALALPHLVRPGRNGYLYPPGDVAQLAQRLLDVLESPDRRTAMGRASRDIAQTHDHHRSLDRFEQIYTEVRPRSWTLSRSASPAARQRDTTVAA
ncbi:glucosyltransferase [Thermobifida fusca YX]|jgi:1,2-diacylglycerol 3-alpha-glucosyltransferase|uniref:Glucosyltransferase n=1 Tax=Thermobifida fusca (strain YX) TaxID=269800 RepID=Q47MN0_THEFY|nr:MULTISPECIES: glycosyltransferase [Thermobifida]AAZ56290.1 glucosyltransferase [Thermobifida fusca YX]MBO2530851.1 glycosyltransferase family 4 protein [Thermobifida sp.]MDD6792401.1 glycosyltransferase [Thermobifida fusca]PPS95878.1 glucosyl transferase [Thermobifida fusca]PZN64153.1 MAG: glycosyltransferase family 4 protein [Thermobifida fusca]